MANGKMLPVMREMLFFTGLILCLGVRLFLKPLMIAFGATAEVLDYSLVYTGITSLGFPFLILTTGGSNLIRADGSPRFSMVCTLTGALINTILDPLFIFTFHMPVLLWQPLSARLYPVSW